VDEGIMQRDRSSRIAEKGSHKKRVQEFKVNLNEIGKRFKINKMRLVFFRQGSLIE